jgi:hypothetical protein
LCIKAKHNCQFNLSSADGELPNPFDLKSYGRKTLCEMLKVKLDTTDAQLKQFYKKEVIKVHADKNPNNIYAQEAFIALNQAYHHCKFD